MASELQTVLSRLRGDGNTRILRFAGVHPLNLLKDLTKFAAKMRFHLRRSFSRFLVISRLWEGQQTIRIRKKFCGHVLIAKYIYYVHRAEKNIFWWIVYILQPSQGIPNSPRSVSTYPKPTQSHPKPSYSSQSPSGALQGIPGPPRIIPRRPK